MIAVFMHLPESARVKAAVRVASLLARSGILYMGLRHGPVPAGRLMYEVTGDEARGYFARAGLEPLRELDGNDPSGRPGVTWTTLVFRRPA